MKQRVELYGGRGCNISRWLQGTYEDRAQRLQTFSVDRVEPAQQRSINIENAQQLPIAVNQWHHDLRAGCRIAGDMARKSR